MRRGGEQHVVVFSRQSGKDELLAQVVAYELIRHHETGGSIVLAADQAAGSGVRQRLIDGCVISSTSTSGSRGIHRRGWQGIGAVPVGVAAFECARPDGQPAAGGERGAAHSARRLGRCVRTDGGIDECVKVFMGTVWSRDTLLARQMRHIDSITGTQGGSLRVWKVTWEGVAGEIPAYEAHVQDRIAQLAAITHLSKPSTSWKSWMMPARCLPSITWRRCRGSPAAHACNCRRQVRTSDRCCR